VLSLAAAVPKDMLSFCELNFGKIDL
jgi:hypothetical protein